MESDFISQAKNTSIQKESQEKSEKKQFLRFLLAPNTKVMLPISQLTEVMTIPIGQIISIPHMNPEVMGVYNWRGEILWMVDLGKIVGLLPWYEQTANKANYKAVVINIDKKEQENSAQAIKVQLGLVVSQIEDIKSCEEKSIYKSPQSSQQTNSLDRFLQGYWVKSDEETIPVLNGETLLSYLPSRTIDIN